MKSAVKKTQSNLPIVLSNLPMVTGNVPTLATRAITYAHTVQAVKLSNDLANYKKLAIQAAQSEFSGIKPTVTKNEPVASKLNAFGNSKGYGDKVPKAGTSADIIWQACQKIGVTSNTNTKLCVGEIVLATMNLVCANGKPVNFNNIAIEVNSYKKYLKNHTI